MSAVSDYSQYAVANAGPEASAMLETFRAVGYDLGSAIADIIDNSITASARNVWVSYNWQGPETSVSIVDDGTGMSNEELIQAMRPGSRSPSEARNRNDLGRFGMGLKTASLSQCRKFCVVSARQGGDPSFWTWDIDYVQHHAKDWQLVRYCPDATLPQKIGTAGHGTAVHWWSLDRVGLDAADQDKAHEKFMGLMEEVRQHLGMVFHRFITAGITIYLNGRRIEEWDPFLEALPGTQLKPALSLGNGKVILKGYVLPHRTKLTAEQYQLAKGPKGSWTDQQGFYIYRNERLLVGGSWLGLFKNEHHFDLCRIRIDLPNDTDAEWQIDIKKSIARPPVVYREQIVSYAREVRNTAEHLYRHRGKIIRRAMPEADFQHMWQEVHKHNKRFYKINRKHPLVKELLGENEQEKESIRRLLTYIEETVPVPVIAMSENRKEDEWGAAADGDSRQFILADLKRMFIALRTKGHSVDEAKAIMGRIEPYDQFLADIEIIETL